MLLPSLRRPDGIFWICSGSRRLRTRALRTPEREPDALRARRSDRQGDERSRDQAVLALRSATARHEWGVPASAAETLSDLLHEQSRLPSAPSCLHTPKPVCCKRFSAKSRLPSAPNCLYTSSLASDRRMRSRLGFRRRRAASTHDDRDARRVVMQVPASIGAELPPHLPMAQPM